MDRKRESEKEREKSEKEKAAHLTFCFVHDTLGKRERQR